LAQWGHEVACSPPSCAEVRKEWIYTSMPLYASMECTGAALPLPFFKIKYVIVLIMETHIIRINVGLYHKQDWRQVKDYS